MTKHHDVSSFDCQNTYLNEFLKGRALPETTRNHSLTFVLTDASVNPDLAIGYFTLKADSYYPEDNSAVDLIPVVDLMCLARDKTYSGQGLGNFLLIEALSKVSKVADLIGVAGVHLMPTREGKRLYFRFKFAEHPLSYRKDLLFLPIEILQQIVRATEE